MLKNKKQNKFNLKSEYSPAGDQINAIKDLTKGFKENKKDQVLLGVTGSGKTFTMANVIKNIGKTTIIMAQNKTLAAQLYAEMTEFFPDNYVGYFVSYYDYFQPEAYVAKTDTYIEKDASINSEIDRMRHGATRALLERDDVIIVSSVSAIYGLGDLETYSRMVFSINVGDTISLKELSLKLSELQYKRNQTVLERGMFSIKGDTVFIFPAHMEDRAWKLSFFGDELEEIHEIDPLTNSKERTLETINVYANSHYVTPRPTVIQAIKGIKEELKESLEKFEKEDKKLESQRLKERVSYDIEMMASTGFCSGIENYSRYLTGRKIGSHPPTLFEYLPKDSLLIVDESHVSVSQIGGMYKGDYARKNNLSTYGFRLPSCKDNRPLKFEEWDKLRPKTVFVSATPGNWELEKTSGEFVEQLIRPTGLLDPICDIRPVDTQVDDLLAECKKIVEKKERVLVTTLTKKMAEDLTDYMDELGIKVRYLHSDIDTLERIEILRDLRLGVFDVLVGINLLREGLDIPECSLVAILDADKEGFLRSKTSLIQTIGRAARHINGRVILYANTITKSIDFAIKETKRRRAIQEKYNKDNNIKVKGVKSSIKDILLTQKSTVKTKNNKDKIFIEKIKKITVKSYINKLSNAMKKSAENLDFEKAVKYRDELKTMQKYDFDYPLSAIPAVKSLVEELYNIK